MATDFQAGIVSNVDVNDELTILSGKARLVATKSPRASETSSPATSTNNPPTPPAQPNLDAYRIAHPSLLAHLREATKSPQLVAPPGWEPMTTHSTPQPPSRQGSQPTEDLFNIPFEGNHNMATQVSMCPESFVHDHEGLNLSPPWDTPPSLGSNEEAMVNAGITMNWDTDWQMYMRQFGMPYVEADPSL